MEQLKKYLNLMFYGTFSEKMQNLHAYVDRGFS